VINENTPDGKHMLLFDVAAMSWSDDLYGLRRRGRRRRGAARR
jgi:hypothetical protein